MKLAEGGLPKGGGVGYEIFDKSDALGATSFVQNINHLRALEGELARTIRAHRPRAGGARASGAAGAAAVLARQGRAVGLDRAQGARHARAAAGARDPPSRRLRRQRAEAAARLGGRRDRPAARRRQRRQTPRRRHRRRAQDRPSSGGCASRSNRSSPRWSGRAARACSSPPISISTASPRPPTSSIRKAAWCARARPARRSWPRGDEPAKAPVSVGNELPGGQQRAGEPTQQQQRDQNRKTEEIVNYEISRTTKTEVIEGGRINRISVAVVVDGNYTKNDKGELAYEPRSKEEIDRIAALVRTAIGFDAKRGDQVEVANLRLAETPSIPIAEPAGWLSFLQFTKDDIMRGIELGVMALLGLIVLLFGVRPLVRRDARRRSVAAAPAVMLPAAPSWPAGAARPRRRRRTARPRRQRHRPRQRQHHQHRRPERLAGRRRRAGHHLQPHLGDDRHRPGAGPGARPVGAEGRRTRRQAIRTKPSPSSAPGCTKARPERDR